MFIADYVFSNGMSCAHVMFKFQAEYIIAITLSLQQLCHSIFLRLLPFKVHVQCCMILECAVEVEYNVIETPALSILSYWFYIQVYFTHLEKKLMTEEFHLLIEDLKGSYLLNMDLYLTLDLRMMKSM